MSVRLGAHVAAELPDVEDEDCEEDDDERDDEEDDAEVEAAEDEDLALLAALLPWVAVELLSPLPPPPPPQAAIRQAVRPVRVACLNVMLMYFFSIRASLLRKCHVGLWAGRTGAGSAGLQDRDGRGKVTQQAALPSKQCRMLAGEISDRFCGRPVSRNCSCCRR